jgi:hypothetical protein
MHRRADQFLQLVIHGEAMSMLKIYTNSNLQPVCCNWYVYIHVLLLEHAGGSHNLSDHIGLCWYVSGASYVEYLI